ncbi:MAG: UMP kinase, partial [Gammaproteobacteria bacterium]|nr:UMP kinase [Gammaproteobacteria bacterium]
LLKLSGEALGAARPVGIDPEVISRICLEIGAAVRAGCQIALVLGGGNLFRGASLQAAGMNRVTGDQMGMLATVMNGLAFRDMLRESGVEAQAYSAFQIPGIVERFQCDTAIFALERGVVPVFVGGTGNPFCTTDTAACLRGIEIRADAVLKATKVDGVYSADPLLHPEAVRFDSLSYQEVLDRRLEVMDLTAICLCRDHKMPVIVFDMDAPGALTGVIKGEKVGTRISEGEGDSD